MSILVESAVNLLDAFYDIHGRKRELLFFYFVPDTTRDIIINNTVLRVSLIYYKQITCSSLVCVTSIFINRVLVARQCLDVATTLLAPF
jgi:hypothetical protein